MKHRKSITVMALTGLMAFGAVGGSLAYLTDTDTAVNEFAAGKVKVHIDGEDQELKLVPGRKIDLTRNVIVEQGSESSFVRVTVRIVKGKVLADMLKDFNIRDQWLNTTFGQNQSQWFAGDTSIDSTVKNETIGDDLVRTYYCNSGNGMYSPVAAADESDLNLGSVFSSFEVPASWDHEDLAKLDGLAIKMEVQAIQAESTGYASTGTPNVRRAWEFWNGQNGRSELLKK